MMTAASALRLIEEIAAEGSRIEKEKLLKDLMADEVGQFIVRQAYDPFVTYGMSPAKQEPGGMNLPFKPVLLQKLLDNLAQRKLTGNAAEREVAEVMQSLDEHGAEILFRIIAKDLKCGIASTTINSVSPGFIPTFAVMRAHHFEEKRIKAWPQMVEPKLDGYRFTFLCRNGNGGFFSRNGIRQPTADHLVEPMIQTALFAYQNSVAAGSELWKVLTNEGSDARSSLNFMVDGEIIVDGSFAENGALRRKNQAADGAVFHVFDLMSYDDFDAIGSVGKPYEERRKLVEEFTRAATGPEIVKTPRYFANSFDEIQALYQSFRDRGMEGAMVKNPKGLYDKKKSHGWLKMKNEDTEDLPIVGFYNGKEHTKLEDTTGGIIVRRVNGVEVRVSGMSDDIRAEILALWTQDANAMGMEGPKVGFKPGMSLTPDEIPDGMVLLGRLVEVEYHEETPDGSLRHPRFVRFRDDKAGEIETKEAA